MKDDFCSLRVFLKRIVDKCGYGSGYNDAYISGYGCISYDQAVFMADSLCQQVILFAGHGLGFYSFLLDNVYVVDNHKFIYLGIEHLVEVREKTINITVPFPEKMMIIFQVGCGQVYRREIEIEIEGLRDDKAVNYLERTDLELMKNTIILVIYFYDIYENHKYYNNGEEIVVKKLSKIYKTY